MVKYSQNAAELLEDARWLSEWIPTKGFNRWLLVMILPSACLESFEKSARSFKTMPRHKQSEIIDELRQKDQPTGCRYQNPKRPTNAQPHPSQN